MTRISINRARLHAGLGCIRIERGSSMRHVRELALLGPSILRPVKVRGRWFIYLYTNGRVRAR